MHINFSDYFDKALSYEDYVGILGENLVLHRRHYDKFNPDENEQAAIAKLAPSNVLVITDPRCGDSLALLPVLRRMAEINGTWQVKIAPRDEHPDLMDAFLTNGTRSVPVFLFLDSGFKLKLRWGPRPVAAQAIFEENRERINSGEVEKSEVIRKIRTYYAKDRGKTSLKELIDRLSE